MKNVFYVLLCTVPMVNFTVAAVLMALREHWVTCGFFMFFAFCTIPSLHVSIPGDSKKKDK